MRSFVKKAGKRLLQAAAAVAVMMCVLLLDKNTIVSEAADIKLNSNAKVRSEASTSSNVVGNAAGGTTLSLLGETTGGDGYVWYQVSVNGATGYIRSDLAEKVSGNMTQAEVERENSYTETSATVSETSVSSGKITVDSANVRKGPSSTDAPLTSVKSGTEVAISGEAVGADGNTWYQVTVNGKTGFVRADLIKAEEAEESNEEEEASQEEAALEEDDTEESFDETDTMEISNVISSRILPADVDLEEMTVDEELLSEWESGNYYVLYTKDSKGKDAWYLYSLEKNQFEQIDSLQGSDKAKESSLGDGLFAGNNKIILLIAAALFLVLIIVCIILALKLHEYRVYYDDEEDDDDDDDGDEEDDDEDEDEDEEEDDEDDKRPVRKPRWSPKNFLSRREEDDEDDEEEEEEDDEDNDSDGGVDEEEYLDDDDFEFEFLNMDGKDKF